MPWAPGWFARSRVYLITAAASLALGYRCAAPPSPGASPLALAESLGLSSDAQVAPTAFDWEPSRGPWLDALLGRRLLFLGTPRGASNNDLFRARVRVSPEGQPLSVRAVRNLTQTAHGDEQGLQVRGAYAVYGAHAFGQLQGVSLLGLDGLQPDERHGSFLNRALVRARSWQLTESVHGISRTHVATGGVSQVRLRLGERALELETEGRTYAVDLETRAFLLDPALTAGPDARVVLTHQHQGGDQWPHTLADLLRTELGPETVALLEDRLFGVEDDIRRLTEEAGTNTVLAPDPNVGSPRPQPEHSWPPASLPSIWASPHTISQEQPTVSEGQWRPLGSEPDPLLLTSFVHPDRSRPYARLWLIAMDMRRLELRMEAGYEEPRPESGLPGRGTLPVDAGLLRRVVATFNGGFKSVHGDYGMMVDGRVLVPPKPGAATVLITQDGKVGLGDWPASASIPKSVVSFRQNLEALLASGRINPKGRQHWGDRVVGQSAVTERSALCRTETGDLLYAWGRDLTGETLAQGLKQARCSYAMALDMNPGHTGFFLTQIQPPESGWRLPPANVQAAAAIDGMMVHPKKYALWSDKDFFYLLRRSHAPGLERVRWTPGWGAHLPSAQGTPVLWSATLTLGTLPIEVLSLEPGDVDFAVTAGKEPTLVGAQAPQRNLSASEAERQLFALTLGHTTAATRYGLSFGGNATIPLSPEYATLLVGPESEIQVLGPGAEPELQARQVAIQLPTLLAAGEVTADARQRGARRQRGGLCVSDAGRVYIALGDHDSSDVIASALLSLGCRDAVALDRASNHPISLTSAGTSAESTTLYGLRRAPTPRTFEFAGDSLFGR